MWGLGAPTTSSPATIAFRDDAGARFRAMDSAKRRIEFRLYRDIRQRERRAPTDQHIIMAGPHRAVRRQPDDLAQPAAYPVALHGIADLPRHRESDADGARSLAPP